MRWLPAYALVFASTGLVSWANAVEATASVISLVPDRSALSDPDTVYWEQLGPPLKEIPQPFQVSTDRGYRFTVLKNNSPTAYIRQDEGMFYMGDFLPGEPLLFSTSQTAFDFRFDPPIRAIGAQLDHQMARSWWPFVQVHTTDGMVQSFKLPLDINNQAEDGSAPFVGVMSNQQSITRVLFDSFDGGNTAIGHLSIVVPEPGLLTLLLALGMAFSRRR